jgi:coniferyl-aldehyde dehydrogenase
MLKLSELTPRTAGEIAGLIADTLGASVARTVQGGPEVAAAFTRLPFDHLLFTGSTARGREVMRAAADHLTPLTLELGGKCPVIVMPDADLERAARAILLGKAMNAGQTCVAPDTVLVVGMEIGPLEAALREACRALFSEGLPTSVQRRSAMGAEDPANLTLAVEPPPGSSLLREEIFGPVLPLVRLDDLPAAFAWIRARSAPLAVYLFTRDRRAEALALASTRAGALVVNGTVVQAAMESLPFGGVGASGFGRYHGRAGFDTFSNQRVHVRVARFSLARLTEPPYDARKHRLIDRLLRFG